MKSSLKNIVFGKPRNPLDRSVFHKISLVAFMAWVGLGADGLSSSTYGPEESFKVLGEHTYLAVALVGAIAFTVFVISYAYSRIIEHFPAGGGGYVVASKLLGEKFGVLSGAALLVDYVLTISVSVAAGADATFSFLPPSWQPWKLAVGLAVIALLMIMNIRGVKDSVMVLAPIFTVFLVTHAVIILGTVGLHLGEFDEIVYETQSGFQRGLMSLGAAGLMGLFLQAYTMGAGTYTGIEAVSNGLQVMREPIVETGKRTMLYMAVSLAVTAGGIMMCYLLLHATPSAGKTMNAVMTENFVGSLNWIHPSAASGFVLLTLVSEAVLLLVAAQAGFVDGPRVMANMAQDSWLPHRFGLLSDRLTIVYGIVIVSLAAFGTLIYTRGNTSTLVLMYSINVFLTFSLSESGMIRYWIMHRKMYPDWSRHIVIHLLGFALCVTILIVNIYEKFADGGWITVLTTSGLVALCYLIRSQYKASRSGFKKLEESLNEVLFHPSIAPVPPPDRNAPTAVLIVRHFDGLGIHSLLTLPRVFPNHFKNLVFISAGVIDSSSFKGAGELENLKRATEDDLKSFVEYANCLGWPAEYRYSVGINLLNELETLCKSVALDYPQSVFFAGKLVFERESVFTRILHNQTPQALERRLQLQGIHLVILPARILGGGKSPFQERAGAGLIAGSAGTR
ncbi:MAG TPA: APC family permease [Candidatus Binatia bacterium]|nr:APC family permease [Candidatus Binatia bacterium]